MLKAEERQKARVVGAMFDSIARRYDLMNRVMSAGQDGVWRRTAVAALAPLPPGPLLDVGIGTGDLAIEMRRHHGARTITGIDLSTGMMQVARAKAELEGGASLHLARADVLRLPFADATFAGVATAFTLRNVADLGAALREIRRVLQPGAPFVCLEITRPRNGLLGALFTVYFRYAVPLVGAAVSRRSAAYRYLPRSVDRFVTGQQLAAAMRRAGFGRVRLRRFWPGAVTLHVGYYTGRPRTDASMSIAGANRSEGRA